jgi:GT2 family glycosyltransferase
MPSPNTRRRDEFISLPDGQFDLVGSVVLYNTALDEVKNAIEQFLAVPHKTHLCVLDNSPTPTELPKYDSSRVTYYFSGQNLGYGRAHNIALRAAAGRSTYSVVMNTDIRYTPDVVSRLTGFLDRNLQAGMAAPKIFYPDGTLQHVCRLLPTPANMFLRRFLPNAHWTQRADALYELRWWDHNCVANIPYFQGSFMLLRTDLCNSLGGFDERFFLYGEDIDLTRRMHQIAETLYVPDVSIVHEYRRYSNRSLRGTWYGIQNNCRYFNKWGWFFDSERKRINRQVVATLSNNRRAFLT